MPGRQPKMKSTQGWPGQHQTGSFLQQIQLGQFLHGFGIIFGRLIFVGPFLGLTIQRNNNCKHSKLVFLRLGRLRGILSRPKYHLCLFSMRVKKNKMTIILIFKNLLFIMTMMTFLFAISNGKSSSPVMSIRQKEFVESFEQFYFPYI